MPYLEDKEIVVTGSSGFLGSNVVEFINLTGLDKKNKIRTPRSRDFNLKDLNMAVKALKGADVVINLAANVGGIGFNRDFPGSLFYDNITMGVNVMEAARINDVEKVVQIGTICSYPKVPPHIPFRESDLWEGYPEETNAPYGIAKKALIIMGEAYEKQYGLNSITMLMVNLYGPKDNFDPRSSHVIPALIKKFTDAKKNNTGEVRLWGTGNASREFLYVKDAARGILQATEKYNGSFPVNLGAGKEITIRELADAISSIIHYTGKIEWDPSMPDGQPRRVLDTSLAQREFGFKAGTDFRDGLVETIDWYNNNYR